MNPAAYWILRCNNQLLTVPEVDGVVFPCATVIAMGDPADCLLVGEVNGLPCYAAEVGAFPEIEGGTATSLRAVFGLAGMDVFMLAGRATQLLDWRANHRYCGRCGTANDMDPAEMAMRCPGCGLLAYPRLSPAVMVLVRKDEKLLLARGPHFAPGVHSALAGFVEPGETVEQCAVREVREEVGIEISGLRYFASQPWPFPNSLMLAFVAEHAAGEITPDPAEIESAEWFSPDALPLLPDPVSLARRLIEAALHGDI